MAPATAFALSGASSSADSVLRVWSFEEATRKRDVGSFVDAFVDEFVRILEVMPPSGLILDVRGNPGGRIPAGERILELLSPIPITPASFHFRSTPLVQELPD
jgi:C-terminal processing protease CtpA/Prc